MACCKMNLFAMFRRLYGANINRRFSAYSRLVNKQGTILGIETSFDDTGCAIIDLDGNILGESLNSQHDIHLNNGGLIPPVAEQLHRQNIEKVVKKALGNTSFSSIDAIAVTTKPGLPLSLQIGTKYAKFLCRLHNKPLIPIHHMEAHALTALMHDPTIQYPFLVLLISGGHCLLALAQGVDDFLLLGNTLDESPGEAYDKLARRMKLKYLPEFSNLSGNAIEMAAKKADDPLRFKFAEPLLQYKDCQFSFAGVRSQVKRAIDKEEEKLNLHPDEVIPDVYNLCAAFQLSLTKHLCRRVQRGMEFVHLRGLMPEECRRLVVSGGVACNNYISEGLRYVCDRLGYKFVRPPPALCVDNGVMIAWNGVERWRANIGITYDYDSVLIDQSAPLGINVIDEVKSARISCEWVKVQKYLVAKNTREVSERKIALLSSC